MQAFIMKSVEISNAVPIVSVDAQSRVIAGLRGLRTWVSPDPAFNVSGVRVERMQKLRFAPVNVPVPNGTINGAIAFDFTHDIYWKPLLNNDEAASSIPDLANGAYTVATVLKANMDVEALMTVVATVAVDRDGVFVQRHIAINTALGSVGVAHNQSSMAETFVGTGGGAVDLSQTLLFMVTYSNGIAKVFVQDLEVASGEIAPINPSGSIIGASGNDIRQYWGLLGEVLEFTEDYSAPALALERAKLVSYLKGKYGIA